MEGIHGEALQAGNLDGLLVVAVEHAGSFAEHVDRATAGATGAENVGVENGPGGAGQVAAGDLFDESWNVDVRGAGGGAGRVETVEAAIGLRHGRLQVERRMQVTEPRGGFRMDGRLLHEGCWATQTEYPLSASEFTLCTIRGGNRSELQIPRLRSG